jgi:hypothetical protein
MKTLKDIVREVESNLVDLLDRKELGRYDLNKDFDKIYKKIDEVVDNLHIVISTLAGRI